jgi:hypothetical protein
LSSAVLDIGAAIGAIHLGKRPVGPPSIKCEHTLLGLLLAGVVRGNIGQVDRQNVGNQDFGGLTAAGSAGLIFVSEVVAKGTLGARAIFRSAARANLERSVSDDPNCSLSERTVGISLFWPKPKASPFPWTRHSSLISWIAASVV